MTDSNPENDQEQIAPNSPFEHERMMTRDRLLAQALEKNVEIRDFGQLGRIVLPDGWVESDPTPQGLTTRINRSFHPKGDFDVSLNVFYRGTPINGDDGKLFIDTLNRHDTSRGPSRLSAQELAQLADAMGFNGVGDNQYTNNAAKGSNAFPVFNLLGAEVVSINGRKALKVVGNFQDQNAMPLNDHLGIFYAADGTGTNIEEIYLSTKSRGKLMFHQRDFDNTIGSIEWRK